MTLLSVCNCGSQWHKPIKKVGGMEFNNIKFFIFSFHNQQLRSEGTLRLDTKSEKLLQMCSKAEYLLLVLFFCSCQYNY